MNIAPASLLRSPSAEAEFNRVGLVEFTGNGQQPLETWTFQLINRSRIDEKASLQNQARLNDSLDQDNLSKIENGLAAGKQFPAIAVFSDGQQSGKLIVSDGNHRNYHCKKYDLLNAYVIYSKNDKLKRLLTKLANDGNGLPHTIERIIHAADEVEKYGATEEDSAKMFNIKRPELSKELGVRKFNSRFSTIKGAKVLDDKTKEALWRCAQKNTVSLADKLIRLVIANPKITAPHIKDYSENYKKCLTAEEQQAFETDMPNFFDRVIKQKGHGGQAKGRAKQTLDKPEFLRLVDKCLGLLRKPQAGLVLSEEEQVRVSVLIDGLRNIRITAKIGNLWENIVIL